MSSDQELDLLLTQLGAAAQDAELGTKYTALYSLDGALDRYFGPRGDQAMARGLWGLSWESLKQKGQELWGRVSPRLHTAFCDEKSEFHKGIADLLKEGEAGIAAALAALVIQAAGGVFPVLAASAVAFFVAKVVLRLFVTETYELLCDEWQKTLKQE